MEYDMGFSVLDLISALFVFTIGFIIINIISSYFNLSTNRGVLIYIWHTFFCFVYFFYVEKFGGDANYYYEQGVKGEIYFRLGTYAVNTFTTFLVHGLGLGKLGCFLFFNILGTIGLLAFDGALKQASANKSKYIKRLATLIIFLPSVSFWSSALGKDSVSLLATTLALWAALQLSKRAKLMVLAICLMLIVRPHMAGMMVIALSASLVLGKEVNIKKRLFLGLITISATGIMVPFALQYAGVSDPTNAESLVEYIEIRQSYNMEGGGGVDISSMSLPMKLFTYMFRPVIFEANSITALAAAVDNMVLLYLFIVGGHAIVMKKRKKITENRKFMWMYISLAWIVLAMTTANLGIAIRQKWMFAPILIFLLISVIGNNKKYNSLGINHATLKK